MKPNPYLDEKAIWIVRAFAFLSFVLSANFLKTCGDPRPLHLQWIQGIFMAGLLNASLLVCCFWIGRRSRYVLAAMLVPSCLGVAFVMTYYGIFWTMGALIFHVWLMVKLLKKVD